MRLAKQLTTFALACTLILAAGQGEFSAAQTAPATAPDAAQTAPGTPEQLQQLVAPIALYPDELVAQVLAAATYPTQVVEADRWLQQNPNLKGNELATAVDQQPWDPSVKALTQFPSVLANLDTNLSWTSALGDAYFNRPQEVLNAVQVMRKRAYDAGKLKNTPQQTVTTQGRTIIVEPASTRVVYVPVYDPWTVYGAPVVVYPGYHVVGAVFAGPVVTFGVGIPIGGVFVGAWNWGWHAWGCNWYRGAVIYNHTTYISRSTTFINRSAFYRGPGNIRPPRTAFPARSERNLRQPEFDHRAGLPARSERNLRQPEFDHRAGLPARDMMHNRQVERGFGEPRGQVGMRSGAFSGFEHGGNVQRSFSRGQSSFRGGMRGGMERRG